MSQHCSLPPPILDPSSGKTFIAIRAPSFIFKNGNQNRRANSDSSNFVYVEDTATMRPAVAMKPTRMSVSGGESGEGKLSVDNWMRKSCSAVPPPGHVPWVSEVLSISPSSSGGSLADTTLITHMQDTSMHVMPSTSSNDSFKIPAFNSGETLLNGSLPSTCSSNWSGKLIGSNKGELRHKQNQNVTRRQERKSRTKSDSNAEARCSDIVSRREAHVLDRRLTLEKISKSEEQTLDHAAETSSDEADTSFQSDAKMASSARQNLVEEEGMLKTPSLVVSTSAAILPVSFDSSADLLNSTPPLAIRRGKKVPFSLDLGTNAANSNIPLEYPNIPSAFQCSPNPESTSFSKHPSYPALVVDTKMTAEDMIASLQSQVRSFHPSQDTQNFRQQCLDAEKWLEDEFSCSEESLSQCPDPGSRHNPTQDSAAPEKKARRSLSGAPNRQGQKHSIIRSPKNRRSENSTTEKKSVRFSIDPPSTIPTDILEMKQPRRESISSGKPSTNGPTSVSPTKRKPAPPVNALASPAPKPLPPTPLRMSKQNAPKISSPLNPHSQISSPRPIKATPKSSKGVSDATRVRGRARGMTVPATPTARRSPATATPFTKRTPHEAPAKAPYLPPPSLSPKNVVNSRARSMTSAPSPSPALRPSLVPTRRRASEAALHPPSKPEPLADIQTKPKTQEATTELATGKKDIRKLKVGISFTRRRSTFSGGNKENVDTSIDELQGRKKDKAGKVISLPFQGVLNLLKG